MKAARIAATAFLSALALGVAVLAEPLPMEAEKFFRWGEYDSLARVLEPWLAQNQGGDGADTHAVAKANLYLGVAYCASGRETAGDRAFLRALRMARGLEIDRFYVSPEIAARFDQVAREERKPKPAAALVTSEAAPAPAPAPIATPIPAIRPKARKTWVWWTVGAGAVLAAAGVTLYLLSQDPPQDSTTVFN